MTFQKGGITNPIGQIRAKPVRDALRAILTRHPSDMLTDKPETVAQELAINLVRKARKGDDKATSEIIDRTEGKATQAIIGGDEDDAPINIKHALQPSDAALIDRYLTQKKEQK